MKILYLTHTVTWKGGGIFYTAFHQARYLARRGHQVTLLSISPSSRFRFFENSVDGVGIVETPDLFWGKARTGWDPWDVLRRTLFLKDRTFDIIHGFESRPVVSLPAFFMRRKLGVPLVMTWADLFGKGGRSEERAKLIRVFMAPVEDFCEKYFFPKADFVIVMGEMLMNKALKLGIPKDKLLSLLHGSDIDRVQSIPQETAKKILGRRFPDNTILLGYLGYLWIVNADLLFQTLRYLKSMLDSQIRLLLIGNHRLDIGKILPSDLRENVIETGWVDYEDVNLYLCASDVLILPLKRTQVSDIIWPSKLNDYLASGRPIVATNMRILESIYNLVQFGCLTDDNPRALAEAIASILTDPALSRELGKNARILAGELSWEKTVDKLEAIYHQLVTG